MTLLLSAAMTAAGSGVTPAEAQTSSENAAAAQALFDQAKALMSAGKYAEACPKLAESDRLDHGMATQFRLAQCYEQIGRIASAWSLYVGVADEAKQAGNPDREAVARRAADALRPRLPMLTIVVAEDVARISRLEIKRNGSLVGRGAWNVSVPVDPGELTIEAAGSRKKPWQGKVVAKEGKAVRIEIPALEDGPESMTSTPEDAGSTGSGQRTGAIIAGSIGVAGVVIGSIYGARTFSKWDDTLSHCQNGDVMRCDAEASGLHDEAVTSGTVSTIGFVVGGVGLAAAAVLWFTAPSSKPAAKNAELQILPGAGPRSGGVVVRGRF
jgi:hypothetical protein